MLLLVPLLLEASIGIHYWHCYVVAVGKPKETHAQQETDGTDGPSCWTASGEDSVVDGLGAVEGGSTMQPLMVKGL